MKIVLSRIVVIPTVIFLLGLYTSYLTWKYAEKHALLEAIRKSRIKIEREIDLMLGNLTALDGLYHASNFVDHNEFKIFATKLLNKSPSVKALEWIPKLEGKRGREKFVNYMRSAGHKNFMIKEKDPLGNLVKSKPKDVYFPVGYVAPYMQNSRAHGFDLYSNGARKKALILASSTKSEVATARINLVQESGDSYGFLIFKPFIDKKNVLQGFNLLVANIPILVKLAVSDSFHPYYVHIYDNSESGPEADFLFSSKLDDKYNTLGQLRETLDQEQYIEREIKFAKRKWTIVLSNERGLVQSPNFWVFLIGVIFSLFVGSFFAFILREFYRSRDIAKLNFELDKSNKELSYEVNVRRKKYEELNVELEKKAQALEVTNHELSQFAYVASHDLQAPLRHVTAYVQVLNEEVPADQLNEDAVKAMDAINSSATRMKSLISDLLSFSRLGKSSLRFSEADVGQLVDNIIENYKFEIEEKSADLVVGSLPSVTCDIDRLSQVFENLLVNALKYVNVEFRPVIEIGYTDRGEEHVFYFRDNGIGIPKGQEERIFRIFQRLHTNKQHSGTGIGLAICKKIVEMHVGSIWVEPNPEHGSTFYFSISKNIQQEPRPNIESEAS